MSDSWFEDWPTRPLGDLAADEPSSFVDGPFGSNLKTADYVENGAVRVIRLGNIKVNEFDRSDESFISEEKFASLRRHEARGGDLVIAALAEPVGRAAIVPGDVGPAIVKADCLRFRAGPQIDNRFLCYALNSPIGLKQTEEAAHGIGRLRVNLGEVRALEVPVPPLDEQQRIVAKLDALRARSRRAKDALDAVPALLDRLRQSILAAAFRGDLTADWREQNPDVEPASELLKRIRIERRKRWEEAELAKMVAKGKPPKDERWKSKYVEPAPVDDSELPELPEGWGWAPLDELCAGDAPICYGVVQPGDDDSNGIPLIRVQDLFEDGLQPDQLRRISADVDAEYARSRVREGDVLVSVVGTIGRVAIAPKAVDGANIARAVARIRASSLMEQFWIASAMNSPAVQHQLGLDAREVARKTLNVETLSRLAIPVPPVDEQRAIAASLGAVLRRAKTIEQQLEALPGIVGNLDSAILAAAFRCELLERESDDAPDVLATGS